MTPLRLAVVALAFLVTAAPGARADRVEHGSMRVGDVQRSWRLFVPEVALRAERVPVVVLLHPGGDSESGTSMAIGTRFDDEAARRGWLAVYPDARGGRFNAGLCCSDVREDVTFVDRLLDQLQRRFAVDRRRVFAAGFSNGGFMAYRLACQRATRFMAVAVVAATEITRRCRPRLPVSVLHIHGKSDPLVGYEKAGFSWMPAGGVRSVVARWRRRDRCAARPAHRSLTDEVDIRLWRCAQRTRVSLIAFPSRGHEWPGAPEPYGDPDAPIDATAEIASFFGSLPPRPAPR